MKKLLCAVLALMLLAGCAPRVPPADDTGESPEPSVTDNAAAPEELRQETPGETPTAENTPAPTDAAASVCFTAVNDQLLPLSDETMPFWSGGTFYVPSSAIDGNVLGIHYNRNLEHTAMVL